LKNVNHENIVSYKDSGEVIYENKKFGFLVLSFAILLFEKLFILTYLQKNGHF
jgi:hypothetical protein